jgi:hypothetical protein
MLMTGIVTILIKGCSLNSVLSICLVALLLSHLNENISFSSSLIVCTQHFFSFPSMYRYFERCIYESHQDALNEILHNYYHKVKWSTMFIAVLFIISRNRKQPKCPSTENWIKRIYDSFTQWNTTQLLKTKI